MADQSAAEIPQMGKCPECGHEEPLYDGLCGFCTDASPEAVETLREAFGEVLEDHDFPTAFWSLDRVYDEYDGEIPNWEDVEDE